MKGSLAKIVSDLIYTGTIVEQQSACIESKIIYTVECNTSYYREGAVEELDNFYWICKELRLPTHNALAFFDAVEQNIESLRKNNKNMLKEVLTYAIAGRGFLFGTYVLPEERTHVRPCDLSMFTKECEESGHCVKIYMGCLDEIAKRRTYGHFGDEYRWLRDRLLNPLNEGSKLFGNWSNLMHEKAEIAPSHIDIPKRAYEAFWNIYSQYSLSQYLEVQEIERKTAESCLEQIKEIGVIILTLDRFWRVLNRIMQVQSNINYKGKWLYSYKKYLNELNAKVRQISSPFDEDLIVTLGLTEFLHIARLSKITPNIMEKYPLWNEERPLRGLKRTERNILQSYRRHPIYRFIKGMESVFSWKGTLEAASFFLSKFLMHNQNPVAPFLRTRFAVNESHTAFQSDLCSLDRRSIQLQTCHQWLFAALCKWWDWKCPFIQNSTLNYYLFQRCQRHMLKRGSITTDIELGSNDYSMETMYIIQDHIDKLLEFDYSMLPQYAKTWIEQTDFQFFYETVAKEKSSKSKEWKIRRRLDHIVTKAVAEEYKKLAFLSPYGIGMSAPTRTWHGELAVWLEKLIRSDDEVSKYVEGEENVLYPGSDFTIDELNASFICLQGNEFHAEDYQPYLAQVELTIQKLCCERIREDMLKKVVSLYRKVFLD